MDEKAGSVYTVSFLLRFFPIVPFHTTEKLPSNLYSATTPMMANSFSKVQDYDPYRSWAGSQYGRCLYLHQPPMIMIIMAATNHLAIISTDVNTQEFLSLHISSKTLLQSFLSGPPWHATTERWALSWARTPWHKAGYSQVESCQHCCLAFISFLLFQHAVHQPAV